MDFLGCGWVDREVDGCRMKEDGMGRQGFI